MAVIEATEATTEWSEIAMVVVSSTVREASVREASMRKASIMRESKASILEPSAEPSLLILILIDSITVVDSVPSRCYDCRREALLNLSRLSLEVLLNLGGLSLEVLLLGGLDLKLLLALRCLVLLLALRCLVLGAFVLISRAKNWTICAGVVTTLRIGSCYANDRKNHNKLELHSIFDFFFFFL